MNKTSSLLPENIKQTGMAGLPFLIVVILFALVGNFGISKVRSIQSEIKTAQNTEKTLTQKLNLLKTITAEVSKTGLVNSAVPESNPSLAVIGQLKNTAITNTVILSAIKSSAVSGDTSGLNMANFSFSVTGAKPQVFNFLSDLAKVAPITIVNKVKITEEAGAVVADINARAYWASLPKTIPSITSPIEDLTTNEKKILVSVSSLIQPSFLQVQLSPSLGDTNPAPFGQ